MNAPWLDILDRFGVAVVVLAAIMFAAWRAGRFAGKHIVRWVDTAIQHWILSSSKRDEADEKLAKLIVETGQKSDDRHLESTRLMHAMTHEITEAITDSITGVGLMVSRTADETQEEVEARAKQIIQAIKIAKSQILGQPYSGDGDSGDLKHEHGLGPKE